MKKIKFILFILFMLAYIINVEIFVNAESTNKDFDFVYWNISEESYIIDFLRDLNINNNWSGSKCHFEEYRGKKYVLEKTVKYDGDFLLDCSEYKVAGLHTLYVLSNLDILSKEGLTAKLKENGIDEEIKKIDFVDPSQEIGDFLFPYTIVITTKNNVQYFFVLQRTDYITIDKIDCNEIEFLTKEQYIERYGEKSGNLYVNGKLVSDKACFWGKNVSVPIRSVLEGLGYEVSYYRNLDYGYVFRGYNIVFSNDKESCTLNTFDSSLTNTIDGSDIGWTWRCYFSKNDNMYFAPDRTLMLIASFFNKTLEIDEENNNIYLY